MGALSVALAQINTQLGGLEANLEKHLVMIKQARQSGAALIQFPELSLTGYSIQDLAPQLACRPTADDRIFAPLLKASQDLDIMVSFVEADRRQRFYIAAAYLSGGELLHLHRKVYLPTYALFDEGRYFAAGDRIRAFDTRFGRVGMLICEDFWHASPPYLLWLDGADILLLSSASPGRGVNQGPVLASAAWVERINQAYSSLFTAFVLHTNRVGFEDGLHFWGGATAYDPEGDLIAKGPYNDEALTMVELELGQLRRTRSRLPLLRDERPRLVQHELQRILDATSTAR